MKTLIINIEEESVLEQFLSLAKKLNIKAKLVDSFKKNVEDKEQSEWLQIAIQSLNNGYAQDEPDISNIAVKEPNPTYKNGSR
jgi:hypothetical protein